MYIISYKSSEWITATKDEYLYGVLEKYGKIASKIKRTRQFGEFMTYIS